MKRNWGLVFVALVYLHPFYVTQFFPYDFCDSGICLAAEKPSVYRRSAVGQIHLPSVDRVAVPPVVAVPVPPAAIPVLPPVVSIPTSVTVNPLPAPVPAPTIPVNQLDLILKTVPNLLASGNNRLAIFYDSTKPFNSKNPLRVFNTIRNGYFSFYPREDGYLQINIGRAPDSLNALSPEVSISRIDTTNLELNQSTTVSLFSDDSALSGQSVRGAYTSLSLDIMPRPRTRYTVVSSSFEINGLTIPPGYIVVGIREADVLDQRPELNEFEKFRIYNPQGALITLFGGGALADLKCSSGLRSSCIDFQKFYTPQGTLDDASANIFSSFSTAQIFRGQNIEDANLHWINIQADLASNTQLNINSAKEAWTERIFNNLSRQEQTYISHVVEFESRAKLQEIFGFTGRVYKDDRARQLDEAQFDALLNYARALSGLWSIENKIAEDVSLRKLDLQNQLAAATKLVAARKILYEEARQAYTNYMKNKSPVVDPKTTAVPETKATNPAPAANPSPPKSSPPASSNATNNANKAANLLRKILNGK